MNGWIEVLTAFAELGPKASRHPEDVCRRVPNAMAVARQLDAEGFLYRNPATGYFAVTDLGMEIYKAL